MTEQGWFNSTASAIAVAIAGAAGGRLLFACYKVCGTGKKVIFAYIALEAVVALMMGFAAYGFIVAIDRIFEVNLMGWPTFTAASWAGWLGPRGLQVFLLAIVERKAK